MKILGREPALWLALFSGLLQLASAFVFHLSPQEQGLIDASAAAVMGAVTAYVVQRDRLVPAVVGALQALLAVAAGFGLPLSAEQQATLMAALAGLAAMFVRTQVWAPVQPDLSGRHALDDG